MTLFFSHTVSAVIQILVFAALPAIWWLCTARRQPFGQWIGLTPFRPADPPGCVRWIVGTFCAFLAFGVLLLYLTKDIPSASSEFAGMGFSALPAIAVFSVFGTSLPEELLFRGFLLKRMSAKWRFGPANTVQALLFGLIHGLLFFPLAGAAKALMITAFTGALAFAMGCINEKMANGSIVPSWAIHAAANLFSGICAAFSLL